MDVSNLIFSAADIENVTDGRYDRKSIQNDQARGLWLCTPSKLTVPGQAALYSFAHLFEAKTKVFLLDNGFTRAQAKQVFEQRLEQQAIIDEADRRARRGRPTKGAIAVWDGDVHRAVFNLPELQDPDGWLWVVYRENGVPVKTSPFRGKDEFEKVMRDANFAFIANISKVVNEIRAYVGSTDESRKAPD